MSTNNNDSSWSDVRLLTARGVAELLDMPVSTIYDLARDGRIGGIVRIGRRIRFDARKLFDWLDRGGQGMSIALSGTREQEDHE